jgi:hypothetical protein
MSEEKDQRKETLEESSVDAPIYPEAVNLENQPPNNTKLGPVAQLAYYKGPLPDPFTFKAYGQVLPDAQIASCGWQSKNKSTATS